VAFLSCCDSDRQLTKKLIKHVTGGKFVETEDRNCAYNELWSRYSHIKSLWGSLEEVCDHFCQHSSRKMQISWSVRLWPNFCLLWVTVVFDNLERPIKHELTDSFLIAIATNGGYNKRKTACFFIFSLFCSKCRSCLCFFKGIPLRSISRLLMEQH